jgi:hypothetical protein
VKPLFELRAKGRAVVKVLKGVRSGKAIVRIRLFSGSKIGLKASKMPIYRALTPNNQAYAKATQGKFDPGENFALAVWQHQCIKFGTFFQFFSCWGLVNPLTHMVNRSGGSYIHRWPL